MLKGLLVIALVRGVEGGNSPPLALYAIPLGASYIIPHPILSMLYGPLASAAAPPAFFVIKGASSSSPWCAVGRGKGRDLSPPPPPLACYARPCMKTIVPNQ